MNYDILNQDEKNWPEKVSDLTIAELFELMIKAIRECKRRDAEQAEIKYRKLTGGKIPKEW